MTIDSPLVSVLLALCLAQAALANAHPVAFPQDARDSSVPSWPPAAKDLPVDPALQWGKLDNGLRYAFLPHNRPAGRMSLRLVVQVGSLDERDDELGAAHFVEHMAFNGTRRFPGNSIDDWFRRHGMRIGMHGNARTHQRYTEYCIDLPTNDPAIVAGSLAVLREFIDGIVFDAAEVAAEKGVIDAEERERAIRERRELERLARLSAGTQWARWPLGTQESRAAFTAESLRAFHKRWYRPENLVVLLVGDFDVKSVPRMVEADLGSVEKPTTPFPAREPRGRPELIASFAIEDPNRADVDVLVLSARVRAKPASSLATLRASVKRSAVCEALRTMLASALMGTDGPALAVTVGTPAEHSMHEQLDGLVLGLRCQPASVLEAVAGCAGAMAVAEVSAVTKERFESVRASALAELDEQLAAQRRDTCAARAQRLAHLLGHDLVPCADDALAAFMRQAWQELTLEACREELRQHWSPEQPCITTVGPPGHGVDADAAWRVGTAAGRDIAKRAKSDSPSGTAKATPPAAEIAWAFAAPIAGAPEPASRVRDQALQCEDVQFRNGVRALFRPSSLTPGEIVVAVSVGSGSLQREDSERAVAQALVLMLPRIGLGALTNEQVQELAAKHRAEVRAGIDAGRFELRATTDEKSLPFQLEWLCALCDTPGSDWQDLSRTLQAYALRELPDEGSSRRQVFRLLEALAGQSVHVPREALLAVDAATVQEALGKMWRGAPITVVVVGDFHLEPAIRLVAATFARLSTRPTADEVLGGIPYVAVQGVQRAEMTMTASEPSGLVAVVAPLNEEDGSGAVMPTRVLARVIQHRLHRAVREKMGTSYAPQVGGMQLFTRLRCNVLWMQARTALGGEAEALAATSAELLRLYEDGITEQELLDTRSQVHNEMRERRATNAYWATEIGRVHARSSAIAELAGFEAALDRVTVADVHAAAKRCLDPAHLSTLRVSR